MAVLPKKPKVVKGGGVGKKPRPGPRLGETRPLDLKPQITKSERAKALKDWGTKEVIRPPGAQPSEETIVESVLNERNFIVAPMEPVSEAPVFAETSLGKIRIEGEVTPQKIEAAKAFERIFQQATDEIMDLAAYTPNPETLDFVKGSRLTESQTQEMLRAAPWTVFQVNGRGLMKTPDNKLESVQAYVYRLEKAVIDVARKKNEEIAALNGKIELLKEDLAEQRKDTRAARAEASKYRTGLVDLQRKFQGLPLVASQTHLNNLGLRLKDGFGKLKALLIQLISK